VHTPYWRSLTITLYICLKHPQPTTERMAKSTNLHGAKPDGEHRATLLHVRGQSGTRYIVLGTCNINPLTGHSTLDTHHITLFSPSIYANTPIAPWRPLASKDPFGKLLSLPWRAIQDWWRCDSSPSKTRLPPSVNGGKPSTHYYDACSNA
jgi:hypothetical protein